MADEKTRDSSGENTNARSGILWEFVQAAEKSLIGRPHYSGSGYSRSTSRELLALTIPLDEAFDRYVTLFLPDSEDGKWRVILDAAPDRSDGETEDARLSRINSRRYHDDRWGGNIVSFAYEDDFRLAQSKVLSDLTEHALPGSVLSSEEPEHHDAVMQALQEALAFNGSREAKRAEIHQLAGRLSVAAAAQLPDLM